MLRVILRHTHNALLFACILLLLCSFERLWRYDYDRDEAARPSLAAGGGGDEEEPEELLQVDHFVFWGGIPAWERSLEVQSRNNPVGASLGLFKFMSFSSAARSWGSSATSKVTDVELATISSSIPTPVLTKDKDGEKPTDLKNQEKTDEKQQQQERHLPTAQPLEEAKILLRRQIRHNKKKHQAEVPQTSLSAALSAPLPAEVSEKQDNIPVQVQQQPDEVAVPAAPEKVSDTDKKLKDNPVEPQQHKQQQQQEQNPPKIGFVLHLPSCDKETVDSWRKVWHEQVVDQPFLFHVLLGASVGPACVTDLQSHLESTNNNSGDSYTMVYQVSQNDHLALSLQTCQSPAHTLQSLLHLEEALYYDASKAKGRLRSSAIMRRFVQSNNNNNNNNNQNAAAATYSSVFTCSGGEQKQAFCDDSVLDCPWFQYSPGRSQQEGEESLSTAAPPQMKLEASIA